MAFRFGHFGLIDVRLQRDAFARSDSRRRQRAADGITTADAGGNFFCELLTIRSGLGVRGFSWIGQETAFYEHRRYRGFSQDVVTPASHAAI